MESPKGESEVLQAFEELTNILRRLRAPDGCPWDRKQTLKTMAPLILEEAYEVLDAVEDGIEQRIAEELGDLSMNLLMTCLIAEETGGFTAAQVFRKISKKLINRHPHVFGNEGPMEEAKFLKRWEEIKRSERKSKEEDSSAVAGIPRAMPALLRGFRMSEKLKRIHPGLPPLEGSPETVQHLLSQLLKNAQRKQSGLELETAAGELLLSLVLLFQAMKINPETALQARIQSLEKFYRALEEQEGEGLKELTEEEIKRRWTGGE